MLTMISWSILILIWMRKANFCYKARLFSSCISVTKMFKHVVPGEDEKVIKG